MTPGIPSSEFLRPFPHHQANKCPKFSLSVLLSSGFYPPQPLAVALSPHTKWLCCRPSVFFRCVCSGPAQVPMLVLAAPALYAGEKYMFTARKANGNRKQTLTLVAYNIFYSRLRPYCVLKSAPRSHRCCSGSWLDLQNGINKRNLRRIQIAS